MLEWAKYRLNFAFEAITSRAHMTYKDTYLVRDIDDDGQIQGIGECALFKGLSADDVPDYEERLTAACRARDPYMGQCSSIAMGLETALGLYGCQPLSVDTIPINGLVWMGSPELMLQRIDDKIAQGYRCIKLKISAFGLEEELQLLHHIREAFPARALELRLDANGAFTPDNALESLDRLARYDIHSIEQPIKAQQPKAMHEICRQSPIPVALDEELIGWWTRDEQCRMLDEIMPQYIILKPSLCGGFRAAERWIEAADERGIGWWATSALESDIGLTAIARWVSQYHPTMPQGLGTGQLFTNNIPSPVRLRAPKGISIDGNGNFTLPQHVLWHQ